MNIDELNKKSDSLQTQIDTLIREKDSLSEQIKQVHNAETIRDLNSVLGISGISSFMQNLFRSSSNKQAFEKRKTTIIKQLEERYDSIDNQIFELWKQQSQISQMIKDQINARVEGQRRASKTQMEQTLNTLNNRFHDADRSYLIAEGILNPASEPPKKPTAHQKYASTLRPHYNPQAEERFNAGMKKFYGSHEIEPTEPDR